MVMSFGKSPGSESSVANSVHRVSGPGVALQTVRQDAPATQDTCGFETPGWARGTLCQACGETCLDTAGSKFMLEEG